MQVGPGREVFVFPDVLHFNDRVVLKARILQYSPFGKWLVAVPIR